MPFGRLSKLCRPIRYVIEIKPCFQNFTFVGKESVTVEMDDGVSEFEMNARHITVQSAKFNGVTVESVLIPESEKVLFKLNQPSLAGSALLDLEFTGIVTDKMEGFYRSHYQDSDGENKCMFSTQFEAANARQAFPCWDEPDFKSVFSLKLIVPKYMTAISNMPVISQVEQDGNCVAYQFDDTPKMSSYLVAFAIGDLEYVEARDSDGVLIRVYSRRGYVSEKGQGEFALDVACRSLPYFGDYFRIRYPLPKLDLLAVPDFAGGAMENWGLVTFRERVLLSNKENASASSKQSIALTVSHELAHMWFGNLVTMRWWTDLWLKEGFANCIEYSCVHHCFPEMDIWTQFTGEQACALRLDALKSSHPIEVEVTSTDEIEEIFDTISYCKGASLIRMLHAFLGDESYRSGLCAYLSKYAYDNAVTEDLWAALGSATGLDVAGIMRPWTRTVGFPVLSVQPIELAGQTIRVQLNQEQYKLPSGAKQDSSGSSLWPIPIVFTCSSEDQSQRCSFKHVFTTASEVINVPLSWTPSSLSDCLIRVNADASGFYHVHYSNTELMRFAQHMKRDQWSTSSRFAFINDGFALAKAGYIQVDDWLMVLPHLLADEDSYSIWSCVLLDGFSTYIRRLVHESDIPIEQYHMFLRKLTRPVLEKLGYLTGTDSESELSHNARLLRSLMISTAGAVAGDPAVVAETKRRYDLHVRGEALLPGDLRAAVYATVVRHSGSDVLNHLMNLYSTTKSPEERSYILGALGGASLHQQNVPEGDASVVQDSPLQRVIQFSLDPNGPVRDQDRVHGLVACVGWSSAARNITWDAMKADWSHLSDIYKGKFLMPSLLKGVLSGFATEQKAAEIKTFFERNPVCCVRAVKQIEETLEINQFLLRRDVERVRTAINKLVSGCA